MFTPLREMKEIVKVPTKHQSHVYDDKMDNFPELFLTVIDSDINK